VDGGHVVSVAWTLPNREIDGRDALGCVSVAGTGRHGYRGFVARSTLLTVALLCLTVLAGTVGWRSVTVSRPSATPNGRAAQAGAPTAPLSTSTPLSTTPAPTTPAGSGSSPSTNPPRPQPGSLTDVAQALLTQINAWRSADGKAPLAMAAGLVASAHKHNLRMSAGCGMQHQCPDEASLGSRISAEGISWQAIAENIGWHSSVSSNGVMAAAMGLNQAMHDETPPDDGHRRNILGEAYHRIGIDVIRDASGKVWLTEDFAN
jgi:uncharacterized protein YkwD